MNFISVRIVIRSLHGKKKKPSKICLSPNVWFITLLVVVFNLCPRGMGWTLIEPDVFSGFFFAWIAARLRGLYL